MIMKGFVDFERKLLRGIVGSLSNFHCEFETRHSEIMWEVSFWFSEIRQASLISIMMGRMCVGSKLKVSIETMEFEHFQRIVTRCLGIDGIDLMIVAVYAPHDPRDKRMLWDYLAHVINQWKGEVVIMGDFNEVRVKSDSTLDRFLSEFTADSTARVGPVLVRFHSILHHWIHHRGFNDFVTSIGNSAPSVELMECVTWRGTEVEAEKRMEVLAALHKIPRPRRVFSFGFYRHFWPVIEHDVYMAVNHFFIHGEIPPGCNSSFIALIPKVPDANLSRDFRPIRPHWKYLQDLAMILSNSLLIFLGEIVNEGQSAFIAEDQMLGR
ncbi:RNA-directed DNA polymerase, eukaryota, reverse transcriptase zinc-binding domain protein [Tanacetum coccineum]